MYERYIKVVAVAGTICLLFWGFEYSEHHNWVNSIDDCVRQGVEAHQSGTSNNRFSGYAPVDESRLRDDCYKELGYRSNDLGFFATILVWLVAIVFGISLVVRYIRVGKFIS